MNLWGILNENLKLVDNKKSKDYLKVINAIKLKEKEITSGIWKKLF